MRSKHGELTISFLKRSLTSDPFLRRINKKILSIVFNSYKYFSNRTLPRKPVVPVIKIRLFKYLSFTDILTISFYYNNNQRYLIIFLYINKLIYKDSHFYQHLCLIQTKMNSISVDDLKLTAGILDLAKEFFQKLSTLMTKNRLNKPTDLNESNNKILMEDHAKLKKLKEAQMILLTVRPPSNGFIVYFNEVNDQLSENYEETDFLTLVKLALAEFRSKSIEEILQYQKKSVTFDQELIKLFKLQYNSILKNYRIAQKNYCQNINRAIKKHNKSQKQKQLSKNIYEKSESSLKKESIQHD